MWLRSMERGYYTLPFPSLSINAVNHAMAGNVAPGLLWWPLDLLLSPLITLVKPLTRFSVSCRPPLLLVQPLESKLVSTCLAMTAANGLPQSISAYSVL